MCVSPLRRGVGARLRSCHSHVIAALLVAGGEDNIDAVDTLRPRNRNPARASPCQQFFGDGGDGKLVGGFVSHAGTAAYLVLKKVLVVGSLPLQPHIVLACVPAAGNKDSIGSAAGWRGQRRKGRLEGSSGEACLDDTAVLHHTLFGRLEQGIALFAGEGGLLTGVSGVGVSGAERGEIGSERGGEVAAGEGDRKRYARQGGVGIDGCPEVLDVCERVEEFAFGGTRLGRVGQYLSVGRIGQVTLHPSAELNGTRQYGSLERVERGGIELFGVGGDDGGIDGVDDIGAVGGEKGGSVCAFEREGSSSKRGVDAVPTREKVLHRGGIGTDSGDRHLRCPPETVEMIDEGIYSTK